MEILKTTADKQRYKHSFLQFSKIADIFAFMLLYFKLCFNKNYIKTPALYFLFEVMLFGRIKYSVVINYNHKYIINVYFI